MRQLFTNLCSALLVGTVALGTTASAQFVEKAGNRSGHSSPSRAVLTVENEKTADFIRKLPQRKTRSAKGGLARAVKGFMPTAAPMRAPLPMAAPGNMPDICGLMTYSNAWDDAMPVMGVYTVPTNANQSFELVFPAEESYAGVALDGIYYATDFISIEGIGIMISIAGYDLESGEKLFSFEPYQYDCIPLCLTADPNTHEIYGVFYDEDGMGIEFGTISYDEDEFSRTVISSLDISDGVWNSIAVSGDGTFYGIRMNQDGMGVTRSADLCTISRETGEVNVIGETGALPQYISDAIIDPNTDRMFWTVSPSDGTGWLYEVDLATGQASQIYQFPNGEEMVGLYLTSTGINPKAPAELKAMEVVFADDSLTGEIRLTAPQLLSNGHPGLGKVTVKVEANGELVGEATGNYGARFTIPVTLDKAGRYAFVAYAENSDGSGPRTLVSRSWLGADTPQDPVVNAAFADGRITLSWDAVTGSQHEGYIDPAQGTYNIYDSKGKQLARDIRETRYSFTIDMPEDLTIYSYVVKAVYSGNESEGGCSNDVILGSIRPPYTPDFTDNALGGWTRIDGDNDGKCWNVGMNNIIYVGFNNNKKLDDWLITPPVRMEAGKAYALNFKLWSQGRTYKERIEIKIGKENTKEAMTTVVMDPLVFNNGTFPEDRMDISKYINIEEDGIYYIGFHACSDAGQYGINISDLTLGEGVSLLAPGPVEGLAATPDPDGELKVNVKFTALVNTMEGNDLGSLTRIEVIRNGTLAKTFNAPAKGAELSFDDIMDKEGQVHYVVAPYNEHGKGVETLLSTWVGMGKPGPAPEPAIARTEKDGEVHLTWKPITFDNRGIAINPAKVTYNIYRIQGGERIDVTKGLTATSHTYSPVKAGDQEFVQCGIFGQTSAGQGSPSYTDLIPVGTPYKGMEESGQLDYIIGVENSDYAEWAIQDDTYDGDGLMKSQDGDNSFFCCHGTAKEAEATIFTGRISLKEMTNPGLSFFLFNQYDFEKEILNSNEIRVEVLPDGATEWVKIADGTVDALCNSVRDAWSQVTINLKDFAGKSVQLRFICKTMHFLNTALDNIRVADLLDHDIKCAEIMAPEKSVCGEKYNVTVKVANHGISDAGDYTVELYADDVRVDSRPGEKIAPGEICTVELSGVMPPYQTGRLEVYGKVVYAADMDESNNVSSKALITPRYTNLPAASNLTADNPPGKVELAWTPAEITSASDKPFTEDFESAKSFSKTFGDWIFIDADLKPVGGMSGITWPGITAGITKGSFWVWDLSVVEATGMTSHSGDKMLFSVYASDDGQIDNWAVSPKINGKAQTISFYARSYTANYPNRIEVWYTTKYADDLTPEDFVQIPSATVGAVPAEWMEYKVEIPAGATRFAIRDNSSGGYLLLVDDVTYIPGTSATGAQFLGYDLYRNGSKVNAQPMNTTDFTDTELVDGNSYEYVVVAVYDKGISAPSNVASLVYSYSSVGSLHGGTAVTVRDGDIIVSGAEGLRVLVAAADGKIVFNGTGSDNTVIPAASGIYVVNVEGLPSVKVIVR